MKKTIILLILNSILAALSLKSDAQPQSAQWSFYLAFEDATEAKDTLWFVLDDTATNYTTLEPYDTGQDPQFGEIPIELNDSVLQVYHFGVIDIFNDDGIGFPDIEYGPFNVLAKPFTSGSAAFSLEFFAHNYELPITIRWDNSILVADLILDLYNVGMTDALMSSNYIFYTFGSAPYCMFFNDGELELSYFEIQGDSAAHFPIFLDISTGNPCAGLLVKDRFAIPINLYPNPATTHLKIETPEPIESIEIKNLQGKTVFAVTGNGTGISAEIDVSTLAPGMYILTARNSQEQGIARFVKE